MGKKKGSKGKKGKDLSDSDDERVAAPPVKEVPKKKAPPKKDTSAFLALDDSETESSSEEEVVPQPVAKKKGPVKKDTSAFLALEDSESSEEESEEEKPVSKKKDTSAFLALDDSESEEDSDASEADPLAQVKVAEVVEVNPHPKDKNLMLAQVDIEQGELQTAVVSWEVLEGLKYAFAPAGLVLPGTSAEVGSKVKGVDCKGMLVCAKELGVGDHNMQPLEMPDDCDCGMSVDAVLAKHMAALELNLPKIEQKVSAPKGGGGGKKKKGKKGKAVEEEDDDDAILAAAMAANATAASPTGGGKKKGKKGKVDDEDDDDAILAAAMAANAPAAEAQKDLDAAKAAEEASKEAAGEDDDGETAETGKKGRKRGGKKDKDKKEEQKKKSGIGGAVAKALAEQREKEEKLRLEAEAKQAAIDEALRLKEEEEARIEAEKAAKKKAKADKKAADKAAGIHMTKADKEKQANQQRKAEMMKKMGLVPSESTSEDTGKKKKVVYEKKKKKGPAKEETPVAEVAPQEEAPAIEEKPVETPAAAVEEEEVVDAWDADDVDWENAEVLTDEERRQKEKEERKAAAKAAEEAEKAAEEEQRAQRAENKRKMLERRQAAEASASKDDLRSPICCIMGHVDTGKTKLLDKIRRTNVQDNEAGGITQQIGATYFPAENLLKATSKMREKHDKMQIKVPGLLIIDTPGHESFSNLRNRGSSLCDIAILVVDIMHGLEAQTMESLKMIQEKNCPFIVALNKIDRIFGWKEEPNAPFEVTLEKQVPSAQDEFEQRLRQTITLFNAEGMNAEVYYKNKDFKEFISLVPTSAHTGEGIPDMLALIVQLCQKMLGDRIMYREEIQATVLEMRVVEGHGATIDIVLVNGELSVGDTIVVCGFNGPIVTTIRALLTPQPMKEIRVKGSYVSHKRIRAAMGIKIAAQNLDNAIAGGNMLVPKGDDDIQDLEDEVMEDLEAVLENDNREDRGVYVQASTLGSLEALLSFLIDSKIPYSAVNIGPVHKKDVMKCSTQLEKNKDYACILAFDVKVSDEAQNLADELGITIYWAEIIYHLFDQFTLRMKMLAEERREAAQDTAVFPCAMKIYEQHIFNSRNPILVGVNVLDGQVRIGTPICVPTADKIVIGKVASIEHDHKNVDRAKKGDDIAVKIEQTVGGQDYYYGRHFDHTDHLVSKLSRESIDLLKLHFKDEMEAGDWLLVKKLKPVFGIS